MSPGPGQPGWGLRDTHPLVTKRHVCPYCENTFVGGDVVVLIPMRPADAEEAAKKAAGRPYTALSVPLHAACALASEGPAHDDPH